MSEVRSGVEVLLEVLATERVRHIFGNPGTTELPLIGALAGDDRFHYVLALHESVAAGMADGYAQATGRPSFLNVHTATGLGNAMGNLSNSRATGSPIVVTAGQQDRRHLLAEPFLSGNLTGMAAGLVKWAHEVHRTADLGPVLRRAFHDAASPPTGPVFVSIPMDVLQDEGEFAVPAASRIERRAVPAALADLASAILAAPRARFAVVAGDEVARSGATGALAALAERLGCRVYGTAMHSTLVFPTDHPLWAGALPADAEQVRAHLAGLHTVLLIGSRGFMTFGYRETWPVPPELRLLHLSPAAEDIGRTYPAWLGLVGDPRATLEALLPLLSGIDETETRELTQAAGAQAGEQLRRLHERARTAGPARTGACIRCRRSRRCWRRCRPRPRSSTRASPATRTSGRSTGCGTRAGSSTRAAAASAGGFPPPSGCRWDGTASRWWPWWETAPSSTRRRRSGRRSGRSSRSWPSS